MKRLIVIIAVMLIPTLSVLGQWSERDSYNRSLISVLKDVERHYDIKLEYEYKNVKDKIVTKADWKFLSDIESTLNLILSPLELRYETNGNKYEIKKWEYFRRPYTEGAKHLEALAKRYSTRQEWEERREILRNNIYNVLGLGNLPKVDLNPIKSNYRRYDGYTVENIALEILPGVWVSGSLYKPEKIEGQIPAFLSPHGHFYNKVDKSIPDERGRYRPDQQYRCAMLARMGVAVFSYDMFAWGESAIAFDGKSHRTDISLIMQTWQSLRIVDYLCEQPWVDSSRIGATGASGGGSQVMFISALDERISISIPVVMTSSHFFGGCPCESGMPIHFVKGDMMTNNAELAAVMAPKPLLIISDGNDWTATLPEIEMPYLQKIYRLFGEEQNVMNVHLENEKHDYGFSKRVALYDFTAYYFDLEANAEKLKDKKGDYDESKVTIELASEMYVFGVSRKLPDHAVLGFDNLRKQMDSYMTKNITKEYPY